MTGCIVYGKKNLWQHACFPRSWSAASILVLWHNWVCKVHL